MTDIPIIGQQPPSRDDLVGMLNEHLAKGEIELGYMTAEELTAAVLGLVQTLVAIHGVEFAQIADTWSDVFTTVLEQQNNA